MQQSYIAAKCTTCNHKFLCENKNEATKLIHICTHALFLGDSLSFIASSSDTSRFVVCTIIFDIFSQLSTKTFAARKFVTTNIFVRVRIISSSFGFTFCCSLFLSLSFQSSNIISSGCGKQSHALRLHKSNPHDGEITILFECQFTIETTCTYSTLSMSLCHQILAIGGDSFGFLYIKCMGLVHRSLRLHKPIQNKIYWTLWTHLRGRKKTN